ncbi:unnamed protein product [Ectocarpus sp. CCAP 1310/34]|nr:unnamed protein product [Ectocarpus sp. CCAP 1310/34]
MRSGGVGSALVRQVQGADARVSMAVGVGSNAHVIFVRGDRPHQNGGRAPCTRP